MDESVLVRNLKKHYEQLFVVKHIYNSDVAICVHIINYCNTGVFNR